MLTPLSAQYHKYPIASMAYEGSYTDGPFQNAGRYRRDNLNANYTTTVRPDEKLGFRLFRLPHPEKQVLLGGDCGVGLSLAFFPLLRTRSDLAAIRQDMPG